MSAAQYQRLDTPSHLGISPSRQFNQRGLVVRGEEVLAAYGAARIQVDAAIGDVAFDLRFGQAVVGGTDPVQPIPAHNFTLCATQGGQRVVVAIIQSGRPVGEVAPVGGQRVCLCQQTASVHGGGGVEVYGTIVDVAFHLGFAELGVGIAVCNVAGNALVAQSAVVWPTRRRCHR